MLPVLLAVPGRRRTMPKSRPLLLVSLPSTKRPRLKPLSGGVPAGSVGWCYRRNRLRRMRTWNATGPLLPSGINVSTTVPAPSSNSIPSFIVLERAGDDLLTFATPVSQSRNTAGGIEE